MENPERKKNFAKFRRRARVRAKISGTKERPRLSVFRSLRLVSAQLVDDAAGVTLVSASAKSEKLKGSKTEQAAALGKILAAKAKEKGISQAVFDKAGYSYHGRIKALADGAREGGLEF